MSDKELSSGCRDYTLASRRQAVERVIRAMRERLDEPLTLHDMAQVAYLSPYHFNRVFHQFTGLPPTRFLFALRLEAAKRLLLTTTQSVTDICFEVGYNSLGTFTSRFTELVGCSPCRLRRLAERLTSGGLETLCEQFAGTRRRPAPAPFIAGRVSAPVAHDGFIFVGLFSTQIPQSQPVGGALLTSPGPYHIGRVPDGSYHVMTAAFRRSVNPLPYLLPESDSLLVGVGPQPIVVRDGVARGETDIALRPLQVTDPPLLISLPFLVADNLPTQ